jgi:hypothetical protein
MDLYQLGHTVRDGVPKTVVRTLLLGSEADADQLRAGSGESLSGLALYAQYFNEVGYVWWQHDVHLYIYLAVGSEMLPPYSRWIRTPTLA